VISAGFPVLAAGRDLIHKDFRHMEVISRKEAKALGLKRYFTGKPCKRPHITERLTSNKHCVDCERERERSERKTWEAMIMRCENPNRDSFKWYGARGIKVCARWRYGENGKTGFQCFLADLGKKPTPQHSIDRVNPNGNYEKSNCRWATWSEQRRNQRRILELAA
jgi:hypothetical protein